MRFAPKSLEIPVDNPFKNDLLNREGAIVALTELIQASDAPFVLAIDANWGKGKSTFLEMWACFLRKKNFPLIEFNAWQTDYASDPFVALFQELSSGLSDCETGLAGDKIANLTSNAKSVMQWALPQVVRVGASFVPVVGAQLGEGVAQAIESIPDAQLTAYDREKASLAEFRQALEGAALELADAHGDKPIIIMIDELDRCRPSYAIELLEVAKHVFSVDYVVFVLAINREQLARSVNALYGNEFDADEYLRRFFDVDFALPEPDRERFIDAHLVDIEFQESYDRTRFWEIAMGSQYARSVIRLLLGDPVLSLRDVQKTILRLGLVMASLEGRERSLVMVATVLIALRAFNRSLYLRFIQGAARDLEVVKYLRGQVGEIDVRQRDSMLVIERVVVAIDIVRQRDQARNRAEAQAIDTPMLKRCREVVDGQQRASEEEVSQASELIAFSDDLKTSTHPDVRTSYRPLINRIELVANSIETS